MYRASASIVLVPAVLLCLVYFLAIFPTGAWSQTNPASSSTKVQDNITCPNGSVIKRPSICPSKVGKILYVLGFVPATNDVFESDNIIPAAYAAVDEINSNCDILTNYTLQIDFVNTLCNPSEATWQLIDSIILSNTSNKITFLGGGCSLATEPVAALSGRFYKIPQISYGASSPSLSQRNMFPRFVRTIPSEIQANMARFALMDKYDWTRVATLHETQTIFSLAVNDFHQRYDRIYNYNTTGEDQSEDEENLIPRSFTDDPEIPLNQIMEREIRIIFGYFYEDKANTVVCQAYRMGLFSNNHFWAFPAWFTYGWWDKEYVSENHNCTREEMNRAVNLSFYLDSYNYGERPQSGQEQTLFTKSNSDQFDKKYDCYNNEFRTNPETRSLTRSDSRPHIYRTFSYDAVYVIANALNKTDEWLAEQRAGDPTFNLTLDDYAYFDENNVSMKITEFMKKTNFNGITGQVRFDENGTRLGLNAIYQLVLPDWGDGTVNMSIGDYKLLAVHDPYKGFNDSSDSATFNRSITYMRDPIWRTGGGPPKDRRTPRNQFLNSDFVHVCQAFTSIAVIVIIALIVFNNVTLFKPLIKDSAPHINTVILVGCLMMLIACYLLSVDSANPPVHSSITADTPDSELSKDLRDSRDTRYAKICTSRLWILSIAFTLSFGALFAKTWQVYRVYTNPKLQKKPFTMWNFLIFMAVFLFIDVAYLLFWTLVYPFRRATSMAKDDNQDVDNIFEMCQCDNFPYLIGALYVYKGLLVVFGLFLAYESRNVKYYYINDSRFVSIAMYIVVILVGIGAPLSLVLAVHNFINPAYGLAVFMIIASTLSCVLILFIPKFVFMARGKDTMVRENAREEVTVSDGLQLGRTTMDQTEVRTVEEEVTQLKEENEKKDQEIRHLENGVDLKPRNGSDGDSGVLVTADENEVFSTESTANGDAHHRTLVTTPSSGEDDVNGTEMTAV